MSNKKSKKLEKYDWDLEDILAGISLDDLYKNWLEKQSEILKLYPNFYENYDNFKKWLKLEDELEILNNRIFNYVNNQLNENLNDSKWIAWNQKLQIVANEFSIKLSDYNNIILEHQGQIQKYLNTKELTNYQRAYDLVFRTKNHILDKSLEALMSKLTITSSGYGDIFDVLTDSDLKYESVKDANNKVIELKTIADVLINLKSKDRVLRKNTWVSFNKAYHNFETTLSKTLYYNYLSLNTYAKVQKFQDYIDSVCFADEIPSNFIEHIYKAIALFKNLYIRHKKALDKVLKKQLKITKIEPWDRNVDLVKKDIRFSIEKAKEITLEALAILGKEYLENINKALSQNWISWLPKPGKQTGAYSIGGTHGLKKYYISMNFDGTIGSINTLVHELGHSMHSYYFNQSQKIYTSCSIFYAEIASITNEVILGHYWLKKYQNDAEIRLFILNHMITDFFNTTIRQIVFSRFEFEANKLVNNNQPFTKDSLKEIYWNLTKEYQESKKDQKQLKKPYSYALSTIFRIGHFYVGNFYVYKYAIGQIAAIIVADAILKNDQKMLNNYFEFLRSGSSKDPLATISILGIDLWDSKTYLKAYEILEKWIIEFEKLVK